MEPINKSHYPTSRAVGVAIDYINYKMGTPNRLFQREQVISASKERTEVGNKYLLIFSIKDYLNEQSAIKCTAEVLYYSDKNSPPDVKFTLETKPQNYTATKDQEFFSRMMKNKEPLVAGNIPDKFGEVPPELEPIRHLGIVAAGFVKWKNATEDTFFAMTAITEVKQKIKDNNEMELDYNLLIHEMVSQKMIPWALKISWNPSEGLKINDQKRLPKTHPEEN